MDLFSQHLHQSHPSRIYVQEVIGHEVTLLDRLQDKGLLQPPRSSLHPLHYLPGIGTCLYLSRRHVVPPGFVGKSRINGKPFFHPPGSYFFHNPLQKFLGIDPVRSTNIKHGHIEIQQIHEHEIGIISDENRTLRLLLPGTHILNNNEIHLTGVIDMNLNETQSFANVKYFYIEQGHVGLTQKGPFIQEYKPGPHISFDPVETLPTEIKILPQTLRLNPVTLNTAEQLRVTLRPVVYLMISDPGKSLQARRKDNGELLSLEALIEDQIDVTLGRIFMGINLHDMGHKLQNQQSSGFIKKAYASAKPVTSSATNMTDAHSVVLVPDNEEKSFGKYSTVPGDQKEANLTQDSNVSDNNNDLQAQEGYVETKLASALNIAITTTVHDNFIHQLQDKLNDFGITVRDVGFEEVRFDNTIQGQLDAYAQKQIAIRTEALTAQMELELAKQRAENDAIIARCNAKASATVKGIEIEAKRNHTLIEAQTQQEAKNMETAAEAKRILDVGEANAKVGDLIGKSQGGQELAVLEKQSDIAKQLGKGAVYTQMGLPVLGFRAQIPQVPQSALSGTTTA